VSFDEGLVLFAAFFVQGLGLEVAKWLFEKIRKFEGKIKVAKT
jgi:hypothetical protein